MTVWIVGAGYGRSFRAPLLSTLFSEHALARVRKAYPEITHPHLYGDCIRWAHWLYHCLGQPKPDADGGAMVLKLHGSVKLKLQGKAVLEAEPYHALVVNDDDLCLDTLGVPKGTRRRRAGLSTGT